MSWLYWLSILVPLAIVASLARLIAIIPWNKRPMPRRSDQSAKVKTMIVLGSGGHTAEMLKLVGTIDLDRYTPRCYVVAATDHHSQTKMRQFESTNTNNSSIASTVTSTATSATSKKGKEEATKRKDGDKELPDDVSCFIIPRSREVGQSYVSSVWTTLVALRTALTIVFKVRPDLVRTC
jgi:beta-1,4-N-acetylglucosaminyltransferase